MELKGFEDRAVDPTEKSLKNGNWGRAFIRAPRRPSNPVDPLPCPNCSASLTLLEQYHRHFCYACGQYAPEGYGAEGAKKCATCGGILSFVAAYGRLYCFRCNSYPAADRGAKIDAEPAPTPQAGSSGDSSEPPKPTADEEGEAPPAGGPVPELAASVADPSEGADAAAERPPLIRAVVLAAKKSQLLDLCKAYGLHPTGTKEELRERLLSCLEEQEAAVRVSAPTTEPALPDRTTLAETPEAEEPSPLPSAETQSSGTEESDSGSLVVIEEAPEPVVFERPEATPSERVPPLGVLSEPSVPSLERTGTSVSTSPPSPPRIEHPCPTCGGELDFITQYGRWYCHGCKAYAARTFKHACPTCGSTLRWIEQHARWWCDAESRYAPGDLPGPDGRVSVPNASRLPVVPAVAPTTGALTLAVPTHRHRSPNAGIGLAGLGLALWAIYEVFVAIPAVTSIPTSVTIPADIAFLLQFFAFLLVTVGAITGLSSLKGRS